MRRHIPGTHFSRERSQNTASATPGQRCSRKSACAALEPRTQKQARKEGREPYLRVDERHTDVVVAEQQAALAAELVQLVDDGLDGEVVAYAALLARARHYARGPHDGQPVLGVARELTVEVAHDALLVVRQQSRLHEVLDGGEALLDARAVHCEHHRQAEAHVAHDVIRSCRKKKQQHGLGSRPCLNWPGERSLLLSRRRRYDVSERTLSGRLDLSERARKSESTERESTKSHLAVYVGADEDCDGVGPRDADILVPPALHHDRHIETQHERQRDQVIKGFTVLHYGMKNPENVAVHYTPALVRQEHMSTEASPTCSLDTFGDESSSELTGGQVMSHLSCQYVMVSSPILYSECGDPSRSRPAAIHSAPGFRAGSSRMDEWMRHRARREVRGEIREQQEGYLRLRASAQRISPNYITGFAPDIEHDDMVKYVLSPPISICVYHLPSIEATATKFLSKASLPTSNRTWGTIEDRDQDNQIEKRVEIFEIWNSAGCQSGGKRKIPEKTRRPASSSVTIPACENPLVTPPGTEPGSGERSNRLATTDPQGIELRYSRMRVSWTIDCSRWSGAGIHGRGKREYPEKTRRQTASSSTIPTCENPRANLPGSEPGTPRLEASALATAPPLPLY
ncbi:hypothetical protein PR048_024419 [Dryococelus australis]|uniref:Uncharacterized protein n=1 Tax=Dryococelus australis TaxID=614101 RepID=A0ABQ9GNK8_9NEOP|nr:hypothetical protein PR048_024419 [Dryococelus australis]